MTTPSPLQMKYLGSGIDNYCISVTRPDNVVIKILIPMEGSGYPDECVRFRNDPSMVPFGLNLVTSDHYS